MSKSKAPKSLQDAGKALWESIASKYVLRADELTRLEQACKTADVLSMLEGAWAESGFPMVSKGSMGQEVIHPLIGEIRTQRGVLDRALSGLKLPDDESGAVPVNQNRSAAQSSWAPSASRSGRA